MLTHLHEHLHPVQGGGPCAGHGACHGSRRQLLPPHTRRLLLLRELVRDGETVANVQHLNATQQPSSFSELEVQTMELEVKILVYIEFSEL